ncbi:glycosyltransferase [Campylobacter sp. 19-13652]|uniref:glycosyltransferase n=1 Tax=Campylobacter sp. 19-13652 TaxID=2840180 RepID=UPI001C772842|nr:glycosyltransferase [Campylobacter sp. 19-13652]BCX80009.1 glycosyl transferase group 1 [Campylobacter sp. 19-13652]
MKSVFFIDTGLEFGGGSKSLIALISELRKWGAVRLLAYFENDYKTPENRQISDVLTELGVEFIRFKPKPKLNKFKKEILRLVNKQAVQKAQYELDFKFALSLLREISPDAVHLNNHFSTNLAYLSAANVLDIPVIQHLRKNATIEPFKLEILGGLKFMPICVSNATYEFYNAQIKIPKCVIYNPAILAQDTKSNQDTTATKECANSGKITLLMAANYLELKGHELVFEAFLECKRDDLLLLLAGSGKLSPSAEAKLSKLKELGVARELGFVSDMSEAYKAADYLLGFSSDEGLPRVVIEALSCGLGVVFSDIAVAREIRALCTNKDKFHLCKRTSQALSELLSTLKPLIKSPDKGVIEAFSLRTYKDGVVRVYKDLGLA